MSSTQTLRGEVQARPHSRAMKTDRLFSVSVLATVFVGTFTSLAAKPTDFSTAEVNAIWKEVWNSADPKIKEPRIEKLSEKQVVERMAGKWTVMFGVIPDRITVSLRTNRIVEVSGQKDGKTWKKPGQWRVVSDRLILFLEEDDIPSFIFRTRRHHFIFDPWAKTMMSELKREK
jgi:hypothetical protein